MFSNLFNSDTRGQSYTLEAVTASIFLLSAVAFMLQSTAVTPLTASTSNQQIEEQNRVLADDALDVSVEQDTLTEFVRYYNTSGDRFVGANSPEGFYTTGSPPTEFGDLLKTVFADEFIAYNVEVRYRNPSNTQTQTQQIVYQGKPSDNAATASKTVFLYDDMEITAPSNSNTLSEDSNFYIPDAADGALYNVVEVRITVWKM